MEYVGKLTDVAGKRKKRLLRRSGCWSLLTRRKMAGRKIYGRGRRPRQSQRWLAQRRGAWGRCRPPISVWSRHPRGDHSWSAGLRQKDVRPCHLPEMETCRLVKFDNRRHLRQVHWRNRKAYPEVFRVAEGLAPCVFWIDELEKVFAGSGRIQHPSDAGVSSRILAAFLSWMQDRKAPVFVAATCNNVTVLPPELIRKGRIRRHLFFVDLPTRTSASRSLHPPDSTQSIRRNLISIVQPSQQEDDSRSGD